MPHASQGVRASTKAASEDAPAPAYELQSKLFEGGYIGYGGLLDRILGV